MYFYGGFVIHFVAALVLSIPFLTQPVCANETVVGFFDELAHDVGMNEKNALYGFKVTVNQQLTLQKWGFWKKSATHIEIRLAIYADDNGGDFPGSLVAQSPPMVAMQGRIEAPASSGTLSPGSYWLMVNFKERGSVGTTVK